MGTGIFHKHGTVIAAFTLRHAQGTAYDGDGHRVKSVIQTSPAAQLTSIIGKSAQGKYTVKLWKEVKMQNHTLHAHVGMDGILKLEMAIGIANTDLEIILILNPLDVATTVWNRRFFTEIVGGWEGAPLVREPQGMYESRSEFK